MGDSNSVIDIGKLAEPATKLVEKISDAIGGIAKPWQIRRVAQAEADAEIIKAQTAIEITDLQKRALERFLTEEAKKQANIESITEKALPLLKDDSTPEKMEDDWITNFFDKSRLISDEQMQALWSRLLADEANQPGKFSKRTIDVLASLDKSDAECFSKLCSFVANIGTLVPLIYDTQAPIYNNHGVNFDSIIHLENVGLIHHENLAGYGQTGLRRSGQVLYFDKRLYIGFPGDSEPEFDLGHILFSQVGEQLSQIVSASPIDGFEDYLKEKWKEFGYNIEPENKEIDTTWPSLA
jgi:hypothetical protein